MSAAEASERWRRFLLLWATQTASMCGGGLTSFAVGIWVFQKTGSATGFALISVCSTLPTVLSLPVAGALADRWGHRRALLVADVGGVLAGCALVAFFATRDDSLWKLYVLLGLASLVTSLHWPAYTSATTALVPIDRLPKASSMMQIGYVGQQVLAPAIAGATLAAIGIPGLLSLDIASFALAGAAVLLVRIPAAEPSAAASKHLSIAADLRAAFADVKARGLLRLAAYVAFTYLPGGFVIALSTPLVLTISTPVTVGIVTSVMGCGMIAGSVVSTALVRGTGGMRRLVLFDCAMALAMILGGLAPSPYLIGAAGFVFLFGLAGHMSEEQALWQVRVAGDFQGRAMALRRMLTWLSLPLSYGVAGPLADRIFEPWMLRTGPLATSVGAVIGTGRGRGMAFLLMCAGALKLLIAISASQDKTLRSLNAAPAK